MYRTKLLLNLQDRQGHSRYEVVRIVGGWECWIGKEWEKESYSGYCHEMACRLIVGTCELKCDKGIHGKRFHRGSQGFVKCLFWEIE